MAYTYMLVKCSHQSRSWERGDSRSLFNQNLGRMPADWQYRHTSISYLWNKSGYRCAEWADIGWDESHVVMGCSYVSGTGLALEHTLPAQLEQRTGRPTINLGYPGSGADIILDNTIRMIDLGIRPTRVIVIVPELVRLTYYKHTGLINHIPQGELAPMYAEWITHAPNAEHHGWMKLRGARALWASVGVAIDMFERIPIQGYELGPRLPNQIDLARDVEQDAQGHMYAHCGSATQSLWADYIVEAI